MAEAPTALVSATALTHAADTEYLVRKSMTKGYEYISLLTPPIYAAFVLSRHGRSHFSLNRFLRATWVGGASCTVAGGAVEYIRSAYSNENIVSTRRMRAVYDTSSIRADDHSTIGALLGALLTPAVLWKRARSVHLILGGAGIGAGIGLLTHYGRSLSGDAPPKVPMPSISSPSSDA